MNERIKELVDQILPNEKEWHKGDPKDWGYFFSGDELEKFAESLIRKCAQVSEDDITDGDACCTNTAYRISRQIKKHFGVEE
jgi:hypothetical protein